MAFASPARRTVSGKTSVGEDLVVEDFVGAERIHSYSDPDSVSLDSVFPD
jgi:hypothetical protein